MSIIWVMASIVVTFLMIVFCAIAITGRKATKFWEEKTKAAGGEIDRLKEEWRERGRGEKK